MSGVKIDNFDTTDIKLTAIMDTLQALRLGHFKLSLTEMDSTSEPEIAAGSIVEVDGSLIYFDADTEITDPDIVSDGTIYVKMYYDSGLIIVNYTETAPTFSSAKNGWYGTDASSGHRYIAKMALDSSSYSSKMYYDMPIIQYIYEKQQTSWTGSWTGSTSKTATLTFSSTIKAIKEFSIKYQTPDGPPSITAFSISDDIISVTFYFDGSTQNGLYSLLAVAAL